MSKNVFTSKEVSPSKKVSSITFILFSSQKAEAARKKSDWRKKHEEFIQSLQSARTVTDAMKHGNTITLTMNSYVRIPALFMKVLEEGHV